MAGEVAQGVFGGAVTGASSGAPLGPWGMGAGAVIGGISGLMQGKNAKRLDKQYQMAENAVNPIDPGQQAYLQRLRQQERNYRAGSDATSAFAAQQARNVGATTQANLLRAGGPGTVSNLLRAQAGTNNAFAQIGANASQGANQVLGMQGGLINQIAERRYNRQREIRDQAMERSVSARQNLQNMFSGALAMVPGMTASMTPGIQGGGTQRNPNLSALYAFQPPSPQTPQYTPQGLGAPVQGLDNAGQAPWWTGNI